MLEQWPDTGQDYYLVMICDGAHHKGISEPYAVAAIVKFQKYVAMTVDSLGDFFIFYLDNLEIQVDYPLFTFEIIKIVKKL